MSTPWVITIMILAAAFLLTLTPAGVIAVLFTIGLVWVVQRLYDNSRRL